MTYQTNTIDGTTEIIEQTTSQVVLKTKKDKLAKNVCDALNLGAGFGGETPSFFCQFIK
jgi:hypothetical protein